MEPIPSITVSVPKYPTKRNSKLRRFTPKVPAVPEEEFDSKPHGFNKLSDIPDEECDTFEPFGGNYTLSWHTLSRFVFAEERSKQYPNAPLSCFPPSCFPPLSYVPHSKPPKNFPSVPSTEIDHLEKQIKYILHYEDLIDEICNDQLPIHQIQQQQQFELSPAEMLANELRKTLAQREILAQQEMLQVANQLQEDASKKLKRFLSLPALKSRMSGSVRK
jgi:hypothetical protein